MIGIDYTQYFDDFLKTFDEPKQKKIKDIVQDYCDHKTLLPRPKTSTLSNGVQKVALQDVDVVLFYVDLGISWLILTGVEIPRRAA
jgi:hypothetical protein